jgi:hypothetical protein
MGTIVCWVIGGCVLFVIGICIYSAWIKGQGKAPKNFGK